MLTSTRHLKACETVLLVALAVLCSVVLKTPGLPRHRRGVGMRNRKAFAPAESSVCKPHCNSDQESAEVAVGTSLPSQVNGSANGALPAVEQCYREAEARLGYVQSSTKVGMEAGRDGEEVRVGNSFTTGGTPEPLRCARCGEPAPAGADACPACGVFLQGNGAARRHGLFARRLPEDLRQSVEEWRAEVITSQGGLAALEDEPLRAGLIRSLVNTEIAERLIINRIVQVGGLDTAEGRRLHDKLLPTIDRKLKLTVTLVTVDFARRARRIDTARVLSGQEVAR